MPLGVWEQPGEGRCKSTFSLRLPYPHGLTEGLGRAPERQTVRGWASDASPRAGPGTGWVCTRHKTLTTI